ncbi:MAG: hypothetical protein GY854_18865 [Deltaproteobacteria bacterium]|nr:hypothetical protein [Deltaproteobacteria bacterium]
MMFHVVMGAAENLMGLVFAGQKSAWRGVFVVRSFGSLSGEASGGERRPCHVAA